MRIYFLTREPDVCQLLADSFTKPDNEIKIFPIITKLFQTVFDEGILPDILFLDFLYFQIFCCFPQHLHSVCLLLISGVFIQPFCTIPV